MCEELSSAGVHSSTKLEVIGVAKAVNIDEVLNRHVKIAFFDGQRVGIREGFLLALDKRYAVLHDSKAGAKYYIPAHRIVRIELPEDEQK